MGLKERDGIIQTEVIPNQKLTTFRKVVNTQRRAAPSSRPTSRSLQLTDHGGYTHGSVHHESKEWAKRDPETGVNHHVNSVESFWRLFKNSIASTHIHVSKKYMQRYLDEFTFRSNHRHMGNLMFDLLIARF